VLRDLAPTWLSQLGIRSWLLIGVALSVAVVYGALASISGLVMPLVVAAVIGALFSPLVTVLADRGVPRRLGGLLVMVALVLVFFGAFLVTVDGVIEQAPMIGRQVSAGIDEVGGWLDDVGIDISRGDDLVADGGDAVSWLVRGLATSFQTVFSSALAFLAGLLVGLFFLYYVLAEWDQLVDWLARHLGIAPDVGRDILEDSVAAVRQYFLGLTVSSTIVAGIVGGAMLLLGLPLAFTIAIVTLVTSYVPYIGAIFSGAFAFLIALGAGGMGDAVIVLMVVLVAQNLVQTVVQTKLTSDQLQIHPMVNFASTIIGASLAGLLGATLSAPIVAIAVRTLDRLRRHRSTA
jgi:predicted PurR-regulated permease PerM